MDSSEYFYRNVIISKVGKEVSLIDIYNPDVKGEVLEAWFGLVMLMADGQHTVDELFQNLSEKYNGAPPGNLEETIHSVVGRLADMKLVVLTKEPTELPYYLSMPFEHLDIEKAKKLMEDDRSNIN